MYQPKTITTTTEIIVKFSDCDALQMVWHGNYIKYFEDGREDFGRKYGLGYWEIYKQSNLAVPLIHVDCDYKKFVGLGEKLTVESTFIETPAAKIIFEYKIFNAKKELMCTGKTVQVFVDAVTKELLITVPPFYQAWKEKNL
ncbi:MAG TPA: acyl-CoA thioesterase [Bacteroidia bacterium]|nr:acyl-CoA thioesterase [Bacteroidia bacterium]